jgi:hypothetical protein
MKFSSLLLRIVPQHVPYWLASKTQLWTSCVLRCTDLQDPVVVVHSYLNKKVENKYWVLNRIDTCASEMALLLLEQKKVPRHQMQIMD